MAVRFIKYVDVSLAKHWAQKELEITNNGNCISLQTEFLLIIQLQKYIRF